MRLRRLQVPALTRSIELDKTRGVPKSGFGASPFGGSASVPSEFAPLISAYQTVGKLGGPLKATIASASQEYEKQTDSSTPVPSAPVYAARLNGLLKTLANAENAVAECVKAREGLLSGLEKLLDANRAALEEEKAAATQLVERKTEIEEKKHHVEVAIMRALGPAESNGGPEQDGGVTASPEPNRPEMEALTPPVMDEEPFDPPTPIHESPLEPHESISTDEQLPSDLTTSYQAVSISTNGSNKRRRVDEGDDFPDLGGDDAIDADVAEMLKQDTKA
jgi:regulator of Ty1 transposition protein 103